MATTINVLGDTIKIGKAFVSGKDRISVNGDIVFEGKVTESPEKIKVGDREYAVEIETVNKMAKMVLVNLQVYEKGVLVHSGLYDRTGKLVENEEKFRSAAGLQVFSMIGAAVGVALMLGFNRATGVVPGGAIGGAIGGGLGGIIGYGIGALLCGERSS